MAEERVQRRLAAILAADVAGYSRLMGLDETGTRARFNQQLDSIIRPAIEEHRGRVVKTMGDGFLVEFGSVVDAVQCAADVQNGVGAAQKDQPDDRKILFRVGIHLGDVIVESDDIHGDGVNIAARLEGLAQPGEIFVSDMVHTGVRHKLALEFDDLGEKALKNIADPVQVFRVVLKQRNTDVASPSKSAFRRPAVAVLPFQNLGGDPEQEYFADGLTEDIITALSLMRSFPVIARNSTFAYKGRSPDIRQVGEELGARYLIEGSVRKAGNRVRVTAQLINAESGHHVWAERYDRDLDDIFELQDLLTQRIVATVEPELGRAELERSKATAPANLAAWDYVQRGWFQLDKFTRDGNAEARKMFGRALELDPGCAPAFVGIARSHFLDVRWGFSDDHAESQAKLFDAATAALDLDSMDSKAHWVMGLGHQLQGNHDLAVRDHERALELNPSFAYAYFTLGAAWVWANNWETGFPYLHKALELNPLDPRNFSNFYVLAYAYFQTKRFEDAITWATKAIQLRPDFREVHLIRTASLAFLGRGPEAKSALENCRRLRLLSLENLTGPLGTEQALEHLSDGLRKAGWEG